MNCDAIRPYLLDFANDELGMLRSWAIRRHLAHCPKCTEELAAQRHLTAVLRRADLVPPEIAAASISTRRPVPRRALAIGLAVAAVAFGVLLLPSLTQPKSQSAAIAAALERVNTWHLSGWKLIDGQQVQWEVWGRRSPSLYYERVGDIVTWDDGKQRLRVFPPNMALNRPGGLVIKTAVTQTTAPVGFQGDPAYQSLADDQRSFQSFGGGYSQPYEQTPEFAKFRQQWYRTMGLVNENKIYTISKRTWLPTTYQLHFDNRKFERDSEFLKVDYDVELPETITTLPLSTGYSVVDFTRPDDDSLLSGENIVTHHSLSVQANVLTMDKDGNILIEVQGWLGKNPLTADSTFTLNIGTEGSSFDSGPVAERKGQPVKYLSLVDGGAAPGSNFYFPFGPLEPPARPHDLPDAFQISLSASPQLQVRDSDIFVESGEELPSTQSESLFTDNFQWHLALPTQKLRNFAEVIPSTETRNYNLLPGGPLPDSLRRSVPFLLNYKLAEQRRIYYYMNYDYRHDFDKRMRLTLSPSAFQKFQFAGSLPAKYAAELEALKQKFRGRAAYWQKKKLEMWPMGGDTHEDRGLLLQRRLQDTFILAICYQNADDRANCNKTLRQLIRECQPLPQRGGLLRRQSEYALRTGQFPGDVDYKGPS